MKFLKQLTWQAVALILGGGVLFTIIALFAPHDVQLWLLGANGLAGTALGLAAKWRKDPEDE